MSGEGGSKVQGIQSQTADFDSQRGRKAYGLPRTGTPLGPALSLPPSLGEEHGNSPYSAAKGLSDISL